MNTYTKLRSGDWGVRGQGSAPLPGSPVTVTKKSGEAKQETIERVLWKDSSTWIASVVRNNNDARTFNEAKRRRSGAGSAAPVRGYSSYCTDRPDCGCYDCAS